MSSKEFGVGLFALVFSFAILWRLVNLKTALFTAVSVLAVFFGWCYFGHIVRAGEEMCWKLSKLFLGLISVLVIVVCCIYGVVGALYIVGAFMYFSGPAVLAGLILSKNPSLKHDSGARAKRIHLVLKLQKLFVGVIAAVMFIGGAHSSGSWVLSLVASVGLICGSYYLFKGMERQAFTTCT